MQPSVIPFHQTQKWLYISVFILVGVMSVIYRIMKKWGLWKKRIAVWIKQRQLANGVVLFASDTSRSVASGGEESFGTRVLRVLLRRKDNVQVLV
jgi:hypothetical protein